MYRVSTDVVGPLTQTKMGNKYVVTYVDHYTGHMWASPLKSTTADVVAKNFLETVCLKHGFPKILISDNGKNFRSKLYEEMCRLCTIARSYASPLHPESNGLLEAHHALFKQSLAMLRREGPH